MVYCLLVFVALSTNALTITVMAASKHESCTLRLLYKFLTRHWRLGIQQHHLMRLFVSLYKWSLLVACRIIGQTLWIEIHLFHLWLRWAGIVNYWHQLMIFILMLSLWRCSRLLNFKFLHSLLRDVNKRYITIGFPRGRSSVVGSSNWRIIRPPDFNDTIFWAL